MRILHTSDWHLGKKLYKKERVEEHELFLNWLVTKVKEENIDVLVIAGDVFDTPIPTTTALTQFFKFLKELESLSLDQGGTLKKVLILAGNHDSAKLLESPCPFLNSDFIKVVGTFKGPASLSENDIRTWKNQHIVKIEEDRNEFSFLLMPFFRTREILDNPWLQETLEKAESSPSIDETLMISLELLLEKLKGNKSDTRKILLGHHLFGSFLSAGSEQSVALSGLDSLPLRLFQDWDLLLLGHIHKFQVIRNEPPAIYCGSPIPMRFSESNEKYVVIADWENYHFKWNKHQIPVFRPLIRIQTDSENFKKDIIKELEKFPTKEGPLAAYLEILLKGHNYRVLEEIREFISDLPVDLINYYGEQIEEVEDFSGVNMATLTGKTTVELFELYLEKFQFESEEEKSEIIKTFGQLLHEDFLEKTEEEASNEN